MQRQSIFKRIFEGSDDALEGSDDALKGSDNVLKGSDGSWVMDVLSNLELPYSVTTFFLSHPMAYIAAFLGTILIIQIMYKVFWKRKKSNSKMTLPPDP